MKDIILQKIKNSPQLLQIMAHGYTVNALLIGGSRLLGLEDDTSDYDFNVLITDEDYQEWTEITKGINAPITYFEFKGEKIHGFLSSAHCLPAKESYHRYFGIIESHFAFNIFNNTSAIIYVKNDSVGNLFKETLIKELPSALKRCKSDYLEELKTSLKYFKQNITTHLTKEIYHLLIISNLLQNKPLERACILAFKDCVNYNKKRKIGDAAYKFTPAQYTTIQQLLEWLLNYFEKLKL